jgi:hypothetical protein
VTRCASELALESHLLDPRRSRIDLHLRSCPACRARLARMEREGEDFRRYVHPRTVDRIMTAQSGRKPSWRPWLAVLLPTGGLAAAATAALLLVSPVPPSGYTGEKGTPLAMQVWVGDADGAREVSDGGAVPVGSRLRFRIAAGRPCRLWLVSADARGDVSRLYPARGEAAVVQGGATLPGGVALDDVTGPERLFAICSPDPVPLEWVEEAIRRAAPGGADALRRPVRLDGLPAGTTQATLLVEKVR